jgi:hypothetical protein
MNLENTAKLLAHLKRMKELDKTHPFSLSNWYAGPNDEEFFELTQEVAAQRLAMMEGRATNPEDNFKCDTVACIAGHAALIEASEGGTLYTDGTELSYGAQEWLGLDDAQRQALFTPSFFKRTENFLRNDDAAYAQVTIDDAIYAVEHLRDHGYVRYPSKYITKIVDENDPAYKIPKDGTLTYYDYEASFGYSDDKVEPDE